MTEPVFTKVLQIAVVVRDLEASMRRYWNDYGIGPWEIYEFNPGTVSEMTRDGQPAAYAARLALTTIGETSLELIQPLDDDSLYADFLRDHGEGLHHVGMGVPDYAGALSLLHDKGNRTITGGVYNGVQYAYLSTDRDLGFISEIFDWPAGLVQEPDAVYPADAARPPDR
jgi:hypothetical protein